MDKDIMPSIYGQLADLAQRALTHGVLIRAVKVEWVDVHTNTPVSETPRFVVSRVSVDSILAPSAGDRCVQ